MENSSEKRNCSNERYAATSVDRISNLPDSILVYILSLLPTTIHAVRTSVLSRRWKFCWTGVPNLYFSDNEYDGRDHIAVGKERKSRFELFVNRVLLLSTVQSINKFTLKCEYEREPLYFNIWVSNAIIRNVRVLDIYRVDSLLPLPSCLFTCGTLEILHMSGSLEINAPSSVCLPRLTCLKLVAIEDRSKQYASKLISGCPILEFLSIDHRDYYNEESIFTISSPSLKQLQLLLDEGELYEGPYKVEINTPGLESLDFSNRMWELIEVTPESFTSLVKADINVDVYDVDSESDYHNSVVKLVQALDCVKFLNLSKGTTEALNYATASLSAMRFDRLTKLVVKAFCCLWDCLQYLLEAAVNLEVLDFEKDGHHGCDLTSWWNPEKAPRCLEISLKIISFGGLDGFKDELTMIGYILKHGRVLNQMQLHSKVKDIDQKYQLIQKILLFPRRSSTCQIAFH